MIKGHLTVLLLDRIPEATEVIERLTESVSASQNIKFTKSLGENEAIDLLRSRRDGFQAVLIPLDVRDAGDRELLEKLRQPGTPIIVLSEDDALESRLAAARLGAHDSCSWRSVTAEQLEERILWAAARQEWRDDFRDQALAEARLAADRSQRALRDSEALYHSLVENLVQNIFRKDLKGRFTFANTNFCLTVGKHVDQILGKTDDDLFPPDLARKYRQDDQNVLKSGKVFETEEEHETAEGERLFVKVVKTPVYDSDGKIAGTQCIFWDITEQKRAREALAASQERFALAVRGSTDGIWDWDVTTNEIYFSTRFKQLLGYDAKDFDNRLEEWESRLHPDDHDRVMQGIHDHLSRGTSYDVEYRMQTKDGSYRWFWARGLAVRDTQGRALRMAGSISDITARKEAEEQLQQRTADLERSNRDLEQFAYIASHDLKEPLRMVTSYVQLIEHRYRDQLDENALEFIGFAVDGAKRMKRLIDGLLAFSRVGTRGQALKTVSSEEVLKEAISNLEVLIEEKGAEIRHGVLPDVLADRVQLGQLFQNLIGNALKFCREKPVVHVRARPGLSGWIEFEVEDNGIGIHPDHAEKIFQIYQRLHSRAEYDGTGIGLAVCRKIVERHGGRIFVESEPGKGAVFRFTMPAAA